jgi:hypothetical protein
MKTRNVQNFDHWIRNDFQQFSSALEDLYFVQPQKNNVAGVGDERAGHSRQALNFRANFIAVLKCTRDSRRATRIATVISSIQRRPARGPRQGLLQLPGEAV